LTVKREETLLGSAVITVVIVDPPVIVTQPIGGSVNLDESFTFEVVAEGTGPITYEWYHDGAVVGEQSFLQLTNVQAADAGDYHVVISNIAGEVTSDTVTLELVLPMEITQLTKLKEGPAVDLTATAEVTGEEEVPTIYQWSQGGALLEGDRVELTVTATGTEPITYEWYYGEELVEDGTESTLRLTDVQGEDSGGYYVMVSNQLGTEFSEVITLTVVPPPAVTELAGSINVVEGEGVELSVTAASNEPLIYQWSKGEEMIEGATAPILDLGNVEASAEADYKLAISNSEGLAASVVITVSLADPPIIVTQPEGGTGDLAAAFTLKVVAEGTEPMTYQWYRNGALLKKRPGMYGKIAAQDPTKSALQFTGLQAANAGDYHVVVSNIAGEGTSETVTLTVDSPPVITESTQSKEGPAIDLSATAEVFGDEVEPTIYEWSQGGAILEGDNVALTVTVTGTEPISYQ
jgi:hypothetical protein